MFQAEMAPDAGPRQVLRQERSIAVGADWTDPAGVTYRITHLASQASAVYGVLERTDPVSGAVRRRALVISWRIVPRRKKLRLLCWQESTEFSVEATEVAMPPELFELLTPLDPVLDGDICHAKQWRDRVKHRYARIAVIGTLKKGDIIRLLEPARVKVLSREVFLKTLRVLEADGLPRFWAKTERSGFAIQLDWATLIKHEWEWLN